jgi:hypothetical protein
LTIRPLARDSERALIARVRDGSSTDFALLLAQNSAAANDALANLDRLAAVRLLIREFDGRYLTACTTANKTLERLTGERVPVDCESPDSRGDARARWRAIADAPPS